MTVVCMFPGQGSQRVGMGAGLFPRFPELVARADAILGYSLADLCLKDADGLLGRTDHTQPALFAVSALAWLARVEDGAAAPSMMMGHSLGEFTALFAAGVFDFETGLRLVRERGRLMNEAKGGTMLAVIGLTADRIRAVLARHGLSGIDVANLNAAEQTVLAGLKGELDQAAAVFQDEGAIPIPVPVSAPFHSRHMIPTAEAFAPFAEGFDFADPALPVISNVTARPYPLRGAAAVLRRQLVSQITGSVRWVESVQYALARGARTFEEVGPGDVLAKLVVKIQAAPLPEDAGSDPEPEAAPAAPSPPPPSGLDPRKLGSAAFREAYGTGLAYAAGGMYKAIAGPRMVTALGRAGLLGFLGTGGVDPGQVRRDVEEIRAVLGRDHPWGVNLLSRPDRPAAEMEMVDLLLEAKVPAVEAAAFLQVTPPLVRLRYTGARRLPDGGVALATRVVAKVSRPEVAAQFMAPASEEVIDQLVRREQLTEEEAWCARRAPIAHDICVEADSGGHTDQRSLVTALPAIMRLRDRVMAERAWAEPIRVGAAGGIGTPEAAAAAFMLGADFVVTGSVNQCTVEAATSGAVKDILASLDIHDTAYAPAGDMFELGAKVQVAAKGLFFPARANKLFELYRRLDGLDDMDARTREQLESRFFGRGLDEVWRQTADHYARDEPDTLAEAERNPKLKMALVFKRYFLDTTRLALDGTMDQKVNFQIHTGPAMGAFNAWVKGTDLEDWRNRKVAEIGFRLMDGAARLITGRFTEWMG